MIASALLAIVASAVSVAAAPGLTLKVSGYVNVHFQRLIRLLISI
jgi:hypothetical protein